MDTCFANPGTSEMHFVAALDRVPGMRCVLGLFEGVVTGAADGYARMAGKPAATLLHCGPGLANGLANLHNARRASTPMVNIVGDQATYHRPLDAPLTADTEGWARGVSAWVRTATSAATVGRRRRGRGAGGAHRAGPDRHADPARRHLLERRRRGGRAAAGAGGARPPSPTQIEAAPPACCAAAAPALLLLGGHGAVASRALALAAPHRRAPPAPADGAAAPTPASRAAAGACRSTACPTSVDAAVKALAGTQARDPGRRGKPVTFFAYPGKPQPSIPAGCRHPRAGAPRAGRRRGAGARWPTSSARRTCASPTRRRGRSRRAARSTPEAVAATLAALMPEDAIVADEVGHLRPRLLRRDARRAPPHDWLNITGGAIGGGMPLATGAAIGAPGRRVIDLQADGSAMYTVQALWTQAREKLDVTTVLLSNRKYQILLGELANVGANPGRTALDMLDLGNPDIDWVKLAQCDGRGGARAPTPRRVSPTCWRSR